jgi:hypothetical protein
MKLAQLDEARHPDVEELGYTGRTSLGAGTPAFEAKQRSRSAERR